MHFLASSRQARDQTDRDEMLCRNAKPSIKELPLTLISSGPVMVIYDALYQVQ